MKRIFALLTGAAFLTVASWGATIPTGFAAWDVIFPGNSGQVDIVNLTGPNALPPDFPVITALNLSSLNLHMTFDNASTADFGPSYFTLAADSLSWNGSPIPIGGPIRCQPPPS